MKHPLTLVLTALLCPLAAPAGAATPARSPNLLFIITDQQSADAMSCRMGRQFLHTPAMDALADRGMLFTRAYSTNPLCMPFRNSVFTGLYSHQTGITRNVAPGERIDPARFVSMGHYFKRAGYDTAYSGKWHLCYDVNDPQAHGFEIVKSPSAGGPDVSTADGALKFLARPHDRPFLLVASFLNPHNVCELARRLAGREQRLNCGEIGPPPPLAELPPAPTNLAPPRHEPDGMTLMRQAYQVEDGPFPVGRFTHEDWRRLRWGYYRMVELVDREIGRVMAGLRAHGLADDTLVIFTSDHGECAGAHGFNQKTVFYEESARVPLIVAWEGRTPRGTSDRLINTGIDLLPTLLEAAGLTAPLELPGRSVLPLALGRSVDTWRDHVVVQNDLAQAGAIAGFTPQMQGRMVRTERYKYCVYSHGQQRESLIDLEADPGEMNDLATDPQYRPVLLQHRELLARFGRDQGDSLVGRLLADGVKPIPFAATAAPAQPVKSRKKK